MRPTYRVSSKARTYDLTWMLAWCVLVNGLDFTYQCCSRRDIDLQIIAAVVPRQVCREEARLLKVTTEATELLVIGVKHDSVGSGLLNAHSVVCEAVCRMEVKDPEEACTFKDKDLVTLVLQADVCLWGMEPAVFLFG